MMQRSVEDLSHSRIDLAETPDIVLGPMTVRPSRLDASWGGDRVNLEPRVMKVLVALLNASPGVVSRDRLIETCWDGRIVGDDAINRCIVSLRHLAERYDPPIFEIQNVRGVGYFLRPAPDEAQDAAASPVSGWSKAKVPVLLLAAALLAVSVVVFLNSAGPVKFAVSTERLSASSVSFSSQVTAALTEGSVADVRLVESDHSPHWQLVAIGSPEGVTVRQLDLRANGSTVWSRRFGAGGKLSGATPLQAANFAAVVAACVKEVEHRPGKYSTDTVRFYLNSCTEYPDGMTVTLDRVAELREIVAKDPDFREAWVALLGAETGIVALDWPATSHLGLLKSDTARAEREFPDLAEVRLARASLRDPRQLWQRKVEIDRLLKAHPTNVGVLDAASRQAVVFGYHSLSIELSERAVAAQPNWPWPRSGLAVALAMAHRLDAAHTHISAGNQRWFGSRAIKDATYLIALRMGDPKIVHGLAGQGWEPTTSHFTSGLVAARIDPSARNVDKALAQSRRTVDIYPFAAVQHVQALAEFHRLDELYQFLMRQPLSEQRLSVVDAFFRPALDDFRQQPRFLKVLQRYGFLHIYRKTGEWPDYCFDPKLPYDCRREADRLFVEKS